jgi:hypothetical protein
MTNHPNRSRPNLLLVEDGYAYLTLIDAESGDVQELSTCALHNDRYIRIDDGRHYPQLCRHGARRGNTLSYFGPEQLARDCDARLFKTRVRYEAARDAAKAQ